MDTLQRVNLSLHLLANNMNLSMSDKGMDGQGPDACID